MNESKKYLESPNFTGAINDLYKAYNVPNTNNMMSQTAVQYTPNNMCPMCQQQPMCQPVINITVNPIINTTCTANNTESNSFKELGGLLTTVLPFLIK